MTVSEAIKLNSAYTVLQNEAKNPNHSYMIVSPDAVTNDLLVKAFIEFKTGRNSELCKDVYNLPFGEKVLKDDADFVTETAYVMPTELDKKYFVIHSAETANETAQNKLLKTLEEPPETSVIFLLCGNEYSILPTVRSRCRIIRPSAYSDRIMMDVLNELYPACNNPSFVVAIADGNLSKLKETAEKGTETFDFALDLLMRMHKSSEILSFATALIAKKDSLKEFVDALELILRDCLVNAYRPSLIKLKDNVMDIRELSRSYTPEVVLKVNPLLVRAKKRISESGNVNSIVDELLFSILEEKAKCQK